MQLGDVPHLGREPVGRGGTEQLAVLLHRRAATRGVDDDSIEWSERAESRHRGRCPGEGRLLLAGMQLEGSAAVGCRRRQHLEPLGGERCHRGPMHIGEEHALYTAEEQADAPPDRAFRGRVLGDPAADLPPRFPGRDLGQDRPRVPANARRRACDRRPASARACAGAWGGGGSRTEAGAGPARRYCGCGGARPGGGPARSGGRIERRRGRQSRRPCIRGSGRNG